MAAKGPGISMAAASFYSLDYKTTKPGFREILAVVNPPWQETADYLIARTLIRQASLSKDSPRSKKYYAQAEEHLNRFSGSGQFSEIGRTPSRLDQIPHPSRTAGS